MSEALTLITPPNDLTANERAVVFEHFRRRLTAYRNRAVQYALVEARASTERAQISIVRRRLGEFEATINNWAQSLLKRTWMVCGTDPSKECPNIDPRYPTSIDDLDALPEGYRMTRILTSIAFLEITESKTYSAHSRVFLSYLGEIDESAMVDTLKNPSTALSEAQKLADQVKSEHAQRNKTLRMAGIGFGAVAGGLLVGLTGGLAAPLVGAGVTTVMTWLGLGGSIIGLLASGLASSAVVCGALFGVYGARSTAEKVERHTRDVRDLAILPVRVREFGDEILLGDEVTLSDEREAERDTLGARICISGWLKDRGDITAPWEGLVGDNTYALRWELQALEDLSKALNTLGRSEAMSLIKYEVLKRTFLAGLASAVLPPLALAQVGQIIDNPWMNTRALAVKTGAVLGDLLVNSVVGNRPITLVGYSFGSLVILEALKYLSVLPAAKTSHLVQDVFLFGTPAPATPSDWLGIRRVVAGRIVNGYSDKDYVLAVLSRTSDATWGIAGLGPVNVNGVENFLCEDLDGHTAWRGSLGRYLDETTKRPS